MMTELKTMMPCESLVEARASLVELKSQICERVTRLSVGNYGNRLRAIVLTGSLARDEATVVRRSEGLGLLGDAEFLLIFHEQAALPSSNRLLLLRQRIEASLVRQGVRCAVTLGAGHPDYLRGLPPHIFSYELLTCGQVVWGDPLILGQVPAFHASEISGEDAWRLLANRIVEQIELAAQFPSTSDVFSLGALYRTVKLYLDMATSFLVFSGSYAPTYRARLERLKRLAAEARADSPWGDSFAGFVREVEACTEWKLSRQDGEGDGRGGWDFWQRAVGDARLLWRWELARLVGASPQVPEEVLLERWMQLQPLRRRLRGWLVVLRGRGWHRSWREWPRWARAARYASPRYWVYAAASRLLFRLASHGKAGSCQLERDSEIERLEARLPAKPEPSEEFPTASWRSPALTILWNYQQFVKETRA